MYVVDHMTYPNNVFYWNNLGTLKFAQYTNKSPYINLDLKDKASTVSPMACAWRARNCDHMRIIFAILSKLNEKIIL